MSDQNLKSAVDILSETPPPARGKSKYFRAAEGNVRMFQLETALGLAHHPPVFNILRLNARISDLEEMLAARGSDSAKPKEIAAATPAPLPVSASAAINSAPSTEQLRGLCAHLFGTASLPAANAPETIQRAALETRLREAGVKIRGLDHSKHIEFTGFARANAAHFQARAEAFLSAQKSK